MSVAAPNAPSASPDARVRMGWIGVAIIAAGVATRLWLFLSGRSSLDGDEGMMGVMAYHMSRLEHVPIYFYRQHYMGTLEVPLAAILDWFAPAAWKFSAWPVRLSQTLYFVLLCCAHFTLCAKFFGRRVAIWALFFVCFSQWYWMDYSQRMRHVTLMMCEGEAIALLVLAINDRWSRMGRARVRDLALLGALFGLAWWHYQLSIVFFVPAIMLALAFSDFARGALGRAQLASESASRPARGFDPASAAIIAPLLAGLGLLAGLSLGWWSRALWEKGYPHFFYPQLVTVALGTIGACCGALAWRWRRERALEATEGPGWALQRFAPAPIALGFVAGYFPAWWYLVTLKEEFWVARNDVVLIELPGRLAALFLLEFSAVMEAARMRIPGAYDLVPTWRTYVYFILYLVAGYSLLRKLIAPARREERVGAAYFLCLFATLVGFHVILPRSTPVDSPRFLIPAFIVQSAAFALLAETVWTTLETELGRGRVWLQPAFVGAAVLGALALWAPLWLERERVAMDWPSGQKRRVVEVMNELERRGVWKVSFAHDTDELLFGYELQFASGLKIRCNIGSMGDRMVGVLDESKYTGDQYYLWEANAKWPYPDLTEKFSVAGYDAYRLPPGTAMSMTGELYGPAIHPKRRIGNPPSVNWPGLNQRKTPTQNN